MSAATAPTTPLGGRFAQLWAATTTANVGDGILLVGFPLLAVGLTRSPVGVSLVSTLATLPWLLVALHAGALADRHDRRRIMVSAMVLRVAVLAVLAGAAGLGLVTLPVIYVAVVVLGVAEVFADTATQSILPMLVDPARLGAANGRVVAAQTVANDFLGGPIAGLLVGVGAAAVVGAPALLYTMSAVLLLCLRGSYRPPARSAAPMRRDISEGLRYLYQQPILRSLAILAGLLNLAGAGYLAVFVLWAVGEESAVGLTPQGYGLAMAALAVGGVGGALATEHICRRFGEPGVARVAASTLAVLFLIPVWLPEPVAVAAAFAAIGLAVSITKVVVVSLAQRLIRGDLLGRVNATYRMLGLGTMPLGALFGGVLGSTAGLQPVFYTAAGICLVAVAITSRDLTTSRLAHAEPGR